MKYKVMVGMTYGYDDSFECEYTGIEYQERDQARAEYFKAKKDCNVDYAYIKEV